MWASHEAVGVAHLNMHHYLTLSEKIAPNKLLHFGGQTAGIDCTIWFFRQSQMSSLGPNSKHREKHIGSTRIVLLGAVKFFFGCVFHPFRFQPRFQKCLLQRLACLSPVILFLAVSLLVMVSHMARNQSLHIFHLCPHQSWNSTFLTVLKNSFQW